METFSTSSRGSLRYRAVNATSMVDDTLFGSSNTLTNTGRRIVKAPIPPSAVVISADELYRIKNEAVIKSESELLAERELARKQKEERERIARERKDRMRELEKRAASLAKKSDSEIAEDARKKAIREMAEKQIDLSQDTVKLLSSMGQRAIAFTIRDQQLEEKKRLQDIERKVEQRTDMMMELDRLKELQLREEEDLAKRSKRVEDRSVINEQIAARQKARLLELEAREQENLAMRHLMRKYEEEDEVAAARRRVEIERSRAEVVKANEEAIERKKLVKVQEKKELEDILIYQAMKDAEFAKREEEERAIEKAKKERQAKLLAEQEKAQNNAGKLDELRARRAAEAKERQERQREKEEALKKKADLKVLLESRAKQAADKAERAKAIKEQEKEELLTQFQYSKRLAEREEEEARRKAEKVVQFRTTLQAQIEEIQRVRSRQRSAGDGTTIREDLIREEEKLRVIRDRMVRDLESQGVNPKYLSEMRNVDIGKILRR
eukprot:gene9593-10603_t